MISMSEWSDLVAIVVNANPRPLRHVLIRMVANRVELHATVFGLEVIAWWTEREMSKWKTPHRIVDAIQNRVQKAVNYCRYLTTEKS